MIQAVNHGRLNAASFHEFHNSVYEMINAETPAKLGIPAGNATAYKSHIDQLQPYIKRSMVSEHTAVIRQWDKKRDALLRHAINRLCNLDGFDNADIQNARSYIDSHIIAVYDPKLTDGRDQDETTLIRGFIDELQGLSMECMTALGLTTVVPLLKSANDNFETAYLARVKERSTYNREAVLNLRKDIMADYDAICSALEFRATNSSDETADVAMKTAAAGFIGMLNEHVAHFSQYYVRDSSEVAEADADDKPAPDADESTLTQDGTSQDGTSQDGTSEDGGLKPTPVYPAA